MRTREKTVTFAKPYRVRAESMKEYKIMLGKERMDKVKEFEYVPTYLGMVLCNHGGRGKGGVLKVCVGMKSKRV